MLCERSRLRCSVNPLALRAGAFRIDICLRVTRFCSNFPESEDEFSNQLATPVELLKTE